MKNSSRPSLPARLAVLAYGTVMYLLAVATLAHLALFVRGELVPKTLDGGPPHSFASALLVNALLVAVFAVQHGIMARLAFKRWWTRFVPVAIERSTFVFITVVLLNVLIWQWRSVPDVLWSVEDPTLATALEVLGWSGWALVLFASFLIDHFELFGIKQVWRYFRRTPHIPPPFQVRVLYRFVRHPLYLGFMIAFWATPLMTVGHMILSVLITSFVIVGIQLEEGTLMATLGEPYRRYRHRVPMLLPFLKPVNSVAPTTASSEPVAADPPTGI